MVTRSLLRLHQATDWPQVTRASFFILDREAEHSRTLMIYRGEGAAVYTAPNSVLSLSAFLCNYLELKTISCTDSYVHVPTVSSGCKNTILRPGWSLTSKIDIVDSGQWTVLGWTLYSKQNLHINCLGWLWADAQFKVFGQDLAQILFFMGNFTLDDSPWWLVYIN